MSEHIHYPKENTNQTHHPRLARREGGIFIAALDIITQPAWIIIDRLQTHFERRYRSTYRHAKKLFGLDLLLIVIIVTLAMLAVWAFFFQKTLADEFTLTVEATPTQLISGAPVTYTIFYENKSNETIYDAILTVRVPRFFTFLRSFPKIFNERTGSLALGTLLPGEHGQAKITGVFWGEINETSPLFASLSLVSEKTRKRYIKLSRTDFQITHSILETTLVLPDKLIQGQATPFTITYKNTGKETLPQVFFKDAWREGATFFESKPERNNDRWYVGNLAKGIQGIITGTGIFNIPEHTDTASLGFTSFITIGKTPLAQGEVIITKQVIPPPLNVSLSAPLENIARPGETITLTATVHNTGTVTIQDGTIGIHADNPFIDPTKIPHTILVGDIEAGGHATASFDLSLLKTIPSAHHLDRESSKEFMLEVLPIATGVIQNDIALFITIQGEPIIQKIETPFTLIATAHYWTPEGDQIGRGPMPPIVGETTKYWIFLQLEPTTNDLENLTMETMLPPEVVWTGRTNVTMGTALRFHEQGKTVTWNIPHLPATFANNASVTARFEIAFTPQASQIGTAPTLLQNTTVLATDTFTETMLTNTTPRITTDLYADLRARGKSNVQQ